jgi:hypothetical protein
MSPLKKVLNAKLILGRLLFVTVTIWGNDDGKIISSPVLTGKLQLSELKILCSFGEICS